MGTKSRAGENGFSRRLKCLHSPKTETALTLTKVQFAAALSNLVSTKDELKTFYGLYPCIKGNSISFHDFTSKRQGNSLPSENKDSITIKDNFVVS